MKADDQMDQLLREAMAADVPQLSPTFDARVMAEVRPLRLTPLGRAVIAAYVVVAAATSMWFMRDVRPDLIAVTVVLTATVAVGTAAYARRVARSRVGH
jgi:hypothetical protein